MKLNARLIAFCLVTVFQAAAIFLLSAFGDFYVKTKLEDIGKQELQQLNIATAKQVASILNHLEFKSLQVGTQQWALVQQLIESSDLGENGKIYIVDSKTNLPVCHPELKSNPDVAKEPDEAWLELSANGAVTEFDKGDSVKFHTCALGEQRVLLAAQTVGRGNYAVVVQRTGGEKLNELAADAAFPITKLLVGICLMGLFMSTICGLSVIWWAEKRMAEAQDEIDQLSARPTQSKAFIDEDTGLKVTKV